MSRLGATLQLQFISLGLALLIGIPLGIYSAVKQYSRFDFTFTTAAFIGSSMPTFFFGLMFILLFSVLPSLGQEQQCPGWWRCRPGLQQGRATL